MDITVAICTWNRAALLDQTLQGLRQLKIPPDVSWELIVVNNNSTDNTDDIIEKHRLDLPLVKIFEPQQGLSNARNAAVDHAQGQYILWTDDDVLVDSQWVSAYLDAFKRWPDAAVFGGKVLPWFESQPPKWLSDNIDWLGGFYALRDFGDQELVLAAGNYPYGANIAFLTSALKQHRFNPNLGRKGKILSGGEEIEIIRKIREQRPLIIWVSESTVKHWLPRSRMTLKYLKDYHYNQGIYESEKPFVPKRTIFGFPPWLVKKWLLWEFFYITRRITKSDSKVWLKDMIEAENIRGRLVATKALSKTTADLSSP